MLAPRARAHGGSDGANGGDVVVRGGGRLLLRLGGVAVRVSPSLDRTFSIGVPLRMMHRLAAAVGLGQEEGLQAAQTLVAVLQLVHQTLVVFVADGRLLVAPGRVVSAVVVVSGHVAVVQKYGRALMLGEVDAVLVFLAVLLLRLLSALHAEAGLERKLQRHRKS